MRKFLLLLLLSYCFFFFWFSFNFLVLVFWFSFSGYLFLVPFLQVLFFWFSFYNSILITRSQDQVLLTCFEFFLVLVVQFYCVPIMLSGIFFFLLWVTSAPCKKHHHEARTHLDSHLIQSFWTIQLFTNLNCAVLSHSVLSELLIWLANHCCSLTLMAAHIALLIVTTVLCLLFYRHPI